jgi:penicillin-binding protein 1A
MDLGLITPDTTFEDAADIVLNGTSWFPYNDDRKNYGIVTLRYGVVHSLNTISAQVLDLLTPQVSYDFVTNTLGLSLDPADCDYAPLAVGQLTYGVTVREMASAYTIFPNSGIYTQGRTFSAIYDSDGLLVYNNEPETHAAISETTAYWITDILTDAVNEGTGKSAKLDNMPAAGKTGTTSDNKDRWFAGYTPYYVGVVWTGYEKPEKISVSGNPAAQLWKKVMTLIHEDLEYKEFSVPANTYQAPVEGVGTEVPYYVRCIAVDANGGVDIISEEAVGSRIAGRTVTVTAPTIEGYDLVSSPSEVEIVVSDDETDNIVEFIYRSNQPEEDEPEDQETDEPDTQEPTTGSNNSNTGSNTGSTNNTGNTGNSNDDNNFYIGEYETGNSSNDDETVTDEDDVSNQDGYIGYYQSQD